MIILKTDEELAKMRESCAVAGAVRDKVADYISPGITTLELSEYAGRLIKDFGGTSAFLGYRGYPGQICVSVNEEVVHGIPGSRVIEIGDIVSIDVGVRLGEFVGDTACTVMVGVTDDSIMNLVKTTELALTKGIEKAQCGARLSDISHAVQVTAEAAGFSVVRDFVGHGIGRDLHEDPQIPNFGNPGKGPKLKAGMTLAIEPMVNMGRSAVEVMGDGWTVLTRDRMPSAHFEHTVVLTPNGAEIMTVNK